MAFKNLIPPSKRCKNKYRHKWIDDGKSQGISLYVYTCIKCRKKRIKESSFLLHNHKRFDFIWSSPPCPTHSRTNYFTQHIAKVPSYPDMKLWQEIIYLNQFHKGLWIVENVIPYYEPFLPMFKQIGRHFIWSNFKIPVIELPKDEIGTMMKQYVGTGKHAHDKKQEERNAVNSELGLHILNCARFLNEKRYENIANQLENIRHWNIIHGSYDDLENLVTNMGQRI